MREPKPNSGELLQGTLDMLILKTLISGSNARVRGGGVYSSRPRRMYCAWRRGRSIRRCIGWNCGACSPRKWGVSENNRRAKYYRLRRRGADTWWTSPARLAADVGRHRPHHGAGLRATPVGEVMTAVWLRLRTAFRRRQLDRDLEDELQFHLEMRQAGCQLEGAGAAEARFAARRQFWQPARGERRHAGKCGPWVG